MDVIHYTAASRSGAALYVFHLARALARQGAAIRLVCPSDYEYLDRLSMNKDLQVYAALGPEAGGSSKARKLWNMLKQVVAGFCAVRALRRESPIVHANFPALYFFMAPLLVGFRLSGFRSILNVHDVQPHRWLLPWPLRFFDWAAFWSMYVVADTLVVHHQEASNMLRKKFGISPRKVVMIPHGPLRLSDAPIPYEEGDEIVALLFGSLRENKGIHLAIKAVQNMRAEGHPLKLILAGAPWAREKSYWNWCKELIDASPEGITVIDRYLEDEEVKEVVASAHFFLLPYGEFHSQSGVAALALSNGRPIVATQAGGLSDVLLPDRTGVLIERSTVESVEGALLRAVRFGHGGLRKMGRQAFEIYNASYSWDTIAQDYVDVYRKMETRSKRKVR